MKTFASPPPHRDLRGVFSIRVANPVNGGGHGLVVERDSYPEACRECLKSDCEDPMEPLVRVTETIQIRLEVAGQLVAGAGCPEICNVEATFAGKPFALTAGEHTLAIAVLFGSIPAGAVDQLLSNLIEVRR